MTISQMPKAESNTAQSKTRPVAKFRCKNMRITIWSNTDRNGITRHNYILSRSYEVEGKWYETPSWGTYDFDSVQKLMLQAKDWTTNLPSLTANLNAQAKNFAPPGQY